MKSSGNTSIKLLLTCILSLGCLGTAYGAVIDICVADPGYIEVQQEFSLIITAIASGDCSSYTEESGYGEPVTITCTSGDFAVKDPGTWSAGVRDVKCQYEFGGEKFVIDVSSGGFDAEPVTVNVVGYPTKLYVSEDDSTTLAYATGDVYTLDDFGEPRPDL